MIFTSGNFFAGFFFLIILSENCGKLLEEITKDTDRNSYLYGKEAVEYGIADKVLEDK